MERHGASHRVTQKLSGGAEIVSPTYANGKKVTNKRTVAPRSLMFDKEGGHDRDALGSTGKLKQGVADVRRAERKGR